MQTPDAVLVFDAANRPNSVSPGPVKPHALDEPIQIDGDLRDWSDHEATGTSEAIAWTLAEDDESLFIAVAVPAPNACPARGQGYHGGGDWLRLAVRNRGGISHWCLGVEPSGNAAVEELPGHAGSDAPPIRAAVAHDLAGRQLVFELSLPIEHIRDRQTHVISVALSVYREQSGGAADFARIPLAGDAALRGATPAGVGYLNVLGREAQ